MMNPNAKGISTLTVLLALGACGRSADVAPEPQPREKDPIELAPAINAPTEITGPVQPPSYEVAAASAAADRNKALERCVTQPDAVRVQCEQEANAAFAKANADLQHLRGNQE
ncbi:MAG: hypothetical protein ACREST_08710 [Steroidobacteraceae bacterium]